MIEPLRLKDHPGFRRFWAASTISDFGTTSPPWLLGSWWW